MFVQDDSMEENTAGEEEAYEQFDLPDTKPSARLTSMSLLELKLSSAVTFDFWVSIWTWNLSETSDWVMQLPMTHTPCSAMPDSCAP